jgi:hypothetical protein
MMAIGLRKMSLPRKPQTDALTAADVQSEAARG